MEGKFVVQQNNKEFSLMAFDQSQEHSIKYLKEDSESQGLYGQHEEKAVIELLKSEVLQVIDKCEAACFGSATDKDSVGHPDSLCAEQKKFLKDL